jgi:hypothetical protein
MTLIVACLANTPPPLIVLIVVYLWHWRNKAFLVTRCMNARAACVRRRCSLSPPSEKENKTNKTYIVLNDGQILRPETHGALDRVLRAAANRTNGARIGCTVQVDLDDRAREWGLTGNDDAQDGRE